MTSGRVMKVSAEEVEAEAERLVDALEHGRAHLHLEVSGGRLLRFVLFTPGKQSHTDLCRTNRCWPLPANGN